MTESFEPNCHQRGRITAEGENRSPRLLQLRKDLNEGRPEALASFWSEVEQSGTPLVEPASNANSFLVTFLWRGSPMTKNVLVVWAPYCFRQPDKFLMVHVSETDLWFRTISMRQGSRFSYQLSPDDPLGSRPSSSAKRQAQADPFNPRRSPEGPDVPLQRAESLVELPGALPQPWYDKRPEVPHLVLEKHRLSSAILGNEREILVYTPPGYSPNAQPYPVIYVFDGEDPDGLVFATWTIENLIVDQRIQPLVVVRITNPDQDTRSRELACNPEFAEFLNTELVRFVRERYRVTTDPSQTIISGYSLGGLAAARAFATLRPLGSSSVSLDRSGGSRQVWITPNRIGWRNSSSRETNCLCASIWTLAPMK